MRRFFQFLIFTLTNDYFSKFKLSIFALFFNSTNINFSKKLSKKHFNYPFYIQKTNFFKEIFLTVDPFFHSKTFKLQYSNDEWKKRIFHIKIYKMRKREIFLFWESSLTLWTTKIRHRSNILCGFATFNVLVFYVAFLWNVEHCAHVTLADRLMLHCFTFSMSDIQRLPLHAILKFEFMLLSFYIYQLIL